MNLKFLFTLIIITGTFLSFSQSDTLNRLDSNGEKTGWWIVYLDNNLKQLADSSGATHCRYTYYTGKFDHYNMGTIGSDKNPVQSPESDPIKLEGLNLLNGTYTSSFKNGQVRYSLSANNGILSEYKEFYSNGQLKTHLNYSEKCGMPLRNCLKTYDKDGKMNYAGHSRILGD